MDGIQAAILRVKLRYIDDWNLARNKNALIYNRLLSGLDQLQTPKIRENSFHVFHLYVIRTQKRDALAAFLKSKGIDTGIHYPTALPFMPAYRYLGHMPSDFPIAHQVQHEILSLPMFPEITDEQIKYVASSIKGFFK
jgi:dTDP-4-amino-4,6-dideoxygalactose transaminase